MNHIRQCLTIFAMLLSLVLSSCVTQWEGLNRVKTEGSLDIMSLNVHYLVPDRDKTNWEDRRFAVSEAIQDADPDIILFQEMETFRWDHHENPSSDNIQLQWVMETVPGYVAGAVGDPSEFPITQPILYRSDRFELREQGFFFFSETPDTVYAAPWGGRWPSFTTWISLHDNITNEDFVVMNTHLDAFNRENQTKGIAIMLDRWAEVAPQLPIVFGGDYNMFAEDPRLKTMEKSGLTLVPIAGSSFHFGIGLHLYPAIDHFLVSQQWDIEDGGVQQKKWSGQWPSDHHPVYTRIRLR